MGRLNGEAGESLALSRNCDSGVLVLHLISQVARPYRWYSTLSQKGGGTGAAPDIALPLPCLTGRGF